MKLTETQIGILATIGAVMLAVGIFLFSGSHPAGEFLGEETVNTWGVYIEPWFLIGLFVGIPAAFLVLVVRKGKRKTSR